MQRFSGREDLFLEADGSLVEYDLNHGEALMVDQGHVFMFGGEGAFLVKLLGPGKVTFQTMPIRKLAAKINPYVPTDR